MKPAYSRAVSVLTLSFASLGGAYAADSGNGGPGNGRPHGPPPEAIAACQGKSVGATVSFQTRGGQTVTGVCETVDNVLAARPTGRPPAGAPR